MGDFIILVSGNYVRIYYMFIILIEEMETDMQPLKHIYFL